MRSPLSRRRALAGAASLIAAPAILRAQSARAVRIVQQRGLLYLPVDVMVNGGLIAKHAERMGLGRVAAIAEVINSAAAVNDALLSGSADFGTAGPPPLLTVWDKTRGSANEIRALGTMSNVPMTLYTINRAVRTIADFTPADRIAVPAAKVSFNAVMLQIEAEKIFGDAERFDPLTVSMGHPDALATLAGGMGRSAITAHVAVPPFTERGLRLPGAHVVLDSHQVFGGSFTQMMLVGSRRFRDNNPLLQKAVLAALDESIATINADKRAAVTLWKDVHKASDSVDELMAIVSDPRFEFSATPLHIQFISDFLFRQKRVKEKLASWKDIFWPDAWDREGT
ncbi:MAG: sulfonate transport system substrate-binding protein [Methylobacteriaceae bacterium]|nr:sulfonate transport system substrate-binding protein [Methylobacteriaceae bacterium]